MAVQTISRCLRRHSAIGLTRHKRAALRELAVRSTQARFEFVREYWDSKHAERLLRRPHAFSDQQRHAGTLRRCGLTSHQSEVALKDAIAMLRVSWGRAITDSRFRIYRNPRLSDSAKRWMFFVLRWPEHMQTCLDGRIV